MNNKLYVGGLAWKTDSQGLKDAFAEFGEVTDARVITDRETGRSRGFGFVTFASDAEAERALEKDNQLLDGRTIRVSIAREREPRPQRSGGSGGGGGGFGGGSGSGGGGGYRRDRERY